MPKIPLTKHGKKGDANELKTSVGDMAVSKAQRAHADSSPGGRGQRAMTKRRIREINAINRHIVDTWTPEMDAEIERLTEQTIQEMQSRQLAANQAALPKKLLTKAIYFARAAQRGEIEGEPVDQLLELFEVLEDALVRPRGMAGEHHSTGAAA
ncbi:hypothetical protein [Ralstonia pseudosolanacearum]|uniref:hypothetical protein n=1 Tax=Ralstonia pseudosolanacearum TaxID=1310165 RepID=UPI00386F6D12